MELGEHNSELGQWQTAQRVADPRLRSFVHGYFASSSRLRAPVRERHVPSTEVALLVNFGAPHRWLDGGSVREWASRDGAWVVGLHDRHQHTEAMGERHFMVVRFTPLGAHLFLGVPMDKIANESIDLELIDRSLARELMSRVAVAKSWNDRFAAMESLIAERVAQDDVPAAVSATWHRLIASGGRISLGSLASEMDCTRPALIANFRTCVGFPPKTIARLARFNRVLRAVDKRSPMRAEEPASKPYIEAREGQERLAHTISWADIAAECGYFDQAHLIKEFRAFAGRTPAAFLRGAAELN